MESFNLLKYWRGGGGAALAAAAATAAASMHSTATAANTTTVATCVLDPSAETDDEDGGDGDDGPFFDLEFAVPEEDGEGEEEGAEEKDVSAVAVEAEAEEEEEEREFNFAVSSEGGCGGGDGGLRSDLLSPSDDLFFKGELVPLEPSAIVMTSSEADPKPQFAVSLLKSATKLRVFMLGLRKAKSTPLEPNGAPAAPTTAAVTEAVVASPKQLSQPQQSRFFIKFKVEEVPIISLFTRDNSSRNSSGSKATKPQVDSAAAPSSAAAEEKKFSKEVVQKYLNKIKPLYIRVSKRYAEKLRFSGQLTTGGAAARNEGEETDAEAEVAEPPPPPPAAPPVATGTASGVKSQKVNVPAGLKVVCKRLGKSRSASAAVAAVPSPPPQRRDDSLLQLQDGIQSAIAHCKKSFNAAKGTNEPDPVTTPK